METKIRRTINNFGATIKVDSGELRRRIIKTGRDRKKWPIKNAISAQLLPSDIRKQTSGLAGFAVCVKLVAHFRIFVFARQTTNLDADQNLNDVD